MGLDALTRQPGGQGRALRLRQRLEGPVGGLGAQGRRPRGLVSAAMDPPPPAQQPPAAGLHEREHPAPLRHGAPPVLLPHRDRGLQLHHDLAVAHEAVHVRGGVVVEGEQPPHALLAQHRGHDRVYQIW